jgi:hypothetical protein
MPPSPAKAAKSKSKKDRAPARSKARSTSDRANLIFPVARIESRLRKALGRHVRVSHKSAVRLSAGLEYVIARLLERSADLCTPHTTTGVCAIKPHHVEMAIQNSDALRKALGLVALPKPVSGAFPTTVKAKKASKKKEEKKEAQQSPN